MKKRRSARRTLALSFGISLTGHLAILVMVALYSQTEKNTRHGPDPASVPIELIVREGDPSKRPSGAGGTRNTSRYGSINLTPSFVKDGIYLPKAEKGRALFGITNEISKEALFTETKVFREFDQLAQKINRHLDYPDLLAENGISGVATLDLYFDYRGKINEQASRILGSSPTIRGLLSRAARKGLIQWYQSDAIRLNLDQFRDQHYRAEFVSASLDSGNSRLMKTGLYSYRFIRKRPSRNVCLTENEGMPALDLSCAVMRIGGTINRALSDRYKARVIALKDLLSHYDDLGLRGLNDLI